MPRAIVMRAHGGPEVLVEEDIQVAAPEPGQILLRQTAASVNFHDVYVRTGLYRTLALPGTPGLEGVGVVEAVGEGVTHVVPGDRVAYVDSGYGSYAEMRVLDAWRAIKLPDSLGDQAAAASVMKGMTAHVLLNVVGRVRRGMTVVVHAGAGGMGQMLCRWAARLGATVIATTGNEEKAEKAKSCGADFTILYRSEDVVTRVMDITGGKGADVVFDSVGAATFDCSLASLGHLGHLCLYGQASGPVAPLAPARLADRSLTLSRPILFHYMRSTEQLAPIAEATLGAFAVGVIKPIDPLVLPLAQASEAHRVIEAGESPGGIVLVP